MFCPKCGAQLKDDAKFCNKCGAQLQAMQQQTPRQQAYNQQSAAMQPPARKKGGFLVVLLLLILLALAAGGAFAAYRMGAFDSFLSSSDDDKGDKKGSSKRSKDKEDDRDSDEDEEEEDGKDKGGKDKGGKDEDSKDEDSEDGDSKDEGSEDGDSKDEGSEGRKTRVGEMDETTVPTTTAAANIPVTATAKYASQVSYAGLYRAGYVRDTAYGSSNVVQKGSKIDNSAWSAFDGDTITSWQEGRDGDGIGEFIGIGFDRTYQVKVITVLLGNHRSAELYVKNNTPRTLTFQVGGQEFQATFPNEMQRFALEFSQPVEASDIRITVNDVYKGTVYADASIAEVEVYGY